METKTNKAYATRVWRAKERATLQTSDDVRTLCCACARSYDNAGYTVIRRTAPAAGACMLCGRNVLVSDFVINEAKIEAR